MRFDSVIISGELLSYRRTICRFLGGERGGLKCELLRTSGTERVYGIRINQADRLLFTIVMVNEQRSLVVLGVILNHDYQKASILEKGAVSKFLDKHDAAIRASLKKGGSAFAEDEILTLPEIEEGNEIAEAEFRTWQESYYRLDKMDGYIILDEKQQRALQVIPPVMLTGVAGSGKTTMAMMLLQAFAGKIKDGEPIKLLYVSAQPRLVEEIKQRMFTLFSEEQSKEQFEHITFSTYAGLVQRLRGPEAEAIRWISFSKVLLGINGFIERYKLSRDFRTLGGASSAEEAALVIHDEWTLIAGLGGSKEAYLSLGEDQSYISRSEQGMREKVWKEYERFKNQMPPNEVYLPFHCEPQAGLYDIVVVDESILLSYANNCFLRALAINEQICLCYDSHQNQGSNWRPLYLSGFKKREVEIIALKNNFRNPALIKMLMNRILQMKYTVRQGLRDSQEQAVIEIDEHMAEEESTVAWLDKPWHDKNKEMVASWVSSPEFAVVLMYDESSRAYQKPEAIEALRERARERFNTALIFTRREIQGLQYPFVLLFQPLDPEDPRLALMNERGFLEQAQRQTLPSAKAAQKGISIQQQRAINLLNEWYTSGSRAMNKLAVYHDEMPSHLKGMASFLQGEVISSETDAQWKIPAVSEEALKAAWEQELIRQENLKNLEIAARIRQTRLSVRSEESSVTSVKKSVHEEPVSPAPAPTPNQSRLDPRWIQFSAGLTEEKFMTENALKKAFHSADQNTITQVLFTLKTRGLTVFEAFVKAKKEQIFLKVVLSNLGKISADALNCLSKANGLENGSLAYLLSLLISGESEYLPFSVILTLLPQIRSETLNALLSASAGYGENFSVAYWFALALANKPERLPEYQGVMNKVSENTLSALLPANALSNPNTSVAYWLALALGRKRAYLPEYQALMVRVSEAALNALRPVNAGVHANTSAPYWLANALANHPEPLSGYETLMAQVSKNTLNALLPTSVGRDGNTSVAYWLALMLSNHPEYRPQYPALMSQVSNETLCALRPEISGPYFNTSVAYWLANALAKNPEPLPGYEKLMLQVSMETLNALRPAHAGLDANTSVAYFLVSMLVEHPDCIEPYQDFLMSKVSMETLSALRPASGGPDENTSVAYGFAFMLVNQPGYLPKYQGLMSQVSEETLNALRPASSGPYLNTSVASGLACALAKKPECLRHYQRLMKKVYEGTLNALRALNVGINANTSVAYWLAFGIAKKYELLSDYQKLMVQVSKDTLDALRPASAGAETNTSVAYWLARALAEKPEFLKDSQGVMSRVSHWFSLGLAKKSELPQNYQSLIVQVSKDTLNALRPAEAGAEANTSVAYWLARALAEKPEFLKDYQGLMNQVSKDTLNALRPADAGAEANTSVAYWLARALAVRPEFLPLYQDLMSQISEGTRSALCPASVDDGADGCTSVDFHLRIAATKHPEFLTPSNGRVDHVSEERLERTEGDGITSGSVAEIGFYAMKAGQCDKCSTSTPALAEGS